VVQWHFEIVMEFEVLESAKRLKALERELDRLDGFAETMLLTQLDGLLAGVIVCPDLIKPSEWLPLIWGGDETSEPVFEDSRQAEKLIGLVMEHYNSIAGVLHRNPSSYVPILDVDARNGQVLWEVWIDGFEAAMRLRPDAWAKALHADEKAGRAIAGLVTLADISRGDCKLPKNKIDEISASAPAMIPLWVATINDWRIGACVLQRPSPVAPTAQKVGRNDSCPCGSGKKYKKCCGLN
jgi:uncharacterized protein